MFSVFSVLSASRSVKIGPKSSVNISVNSGYDLIPESPDEWKGTVFDPNNETVSQEIFKGARIKGINFTGSGTISVRNEENYERTFVYYLFRHNFCSKVDIVLNPFSGYYYETAESLETTKNTNETMQNYMNRCFYIIMQNKYDINFVVTNTYRVGDFLLYNDDTESRFSDISVHNYDNTETMSGPFFIKWKTDYSYAYGFVRFEFHTTGKVNYSKIYVSNIYTISASTKSNSTGVDENMENEEIKRNFSMSIAVIVSLWIIFIIIVALVILTNRKTTNKVYDKIAVFFEQVQTQLQLQSQSNGQYSQMPVTPSYGAPPTSPYSADSNYDVVPKAPPPADYEADNV